jgi:hypothetical protein
MPMINGGLGIQTRSGLEEVEMRIGFYLRAFYFLKPAIPRPLRLVLRRMAVSSKRKGHSDIWPIDEAAGCAPSHFVGWPEEKKFALILTHDVESAVGHDKCNDLMEMETSLGFRSSFNFVAEKYPVNGHLRRELVEKGFEIGIHGLKHDGKLYKSHKLFKKRAVKINRYLKEWGAVGFRSPAMHHNLTWIRELDIKYDASTFDTDPFEPQSDGVGTIFPFWVEGDGVRPGYMELPYTLPQDYTLFVLMKEEGIDIWMKKLDWIAQKGGMALVNTHPDYMCFGNGKRGNEEYPSSHYEAFLRYAKERYGGEFWHVLPKEIAHFWITDVLTAFTEKVYIPCG